MMFPQDDRAVHKGRSRAVDPKGWTQHYLLCLTAEQCVIALRWLEDAESFRDIDKAEYELEKKIRARAEKEDVEFDPCLTAREVKTLMNWADDADTIHELAKNDLQFYAQLLQLYEKYRLRYKLTDEEIMNAPD